MSDLAIAAIVVGSVVAYLTVAGFLAAEWARHANVEIEAYVFSMIWPITLAPALAFIINERRHDRDQIECRVVMRLREEQRYRDAWIRDLEKQVGIRDPGGKP